jgi:hypothetical protein
METRFKKISKRIAQINLPGALPEPIQPDRMLKEI